MIAMSPRTRKNDDRSSSTVGKHARNRRSRIRRGSLLAEVAISSIMLVIIMGMTVKILGWVALERKAAERREVALQEAANLMERLTAHPFEQVTPELAARCALSPSASLRLPDAELKVDVSESHPDAGRSVKRIAIQLRWRARGDELAAPVRLTSWIERPRSRR
jgi:hypothetical protein